MSLGSRPPGLHAGGSLPEGPSSPAPGQCPRSLPDPGRPTGLQGGSPQPGSQQNDRGDRGSSWGAELVPRWPARLPQRQARWSRCGRRDSGPLCCGPGRQGSSIKLKVPHLKSNRKGRSWGLPGAGLLAPRDAGPCQAGPCQARLCQAGSARRGSWQGGLSPGCSPSALGGFSRPRVGCATCHRGSGKLPWSEAERSATGACRRDTLCQRDAQRFLARNT